VNYKKLVVMLCLGAHFLVTNSVAMAGWNPFKKLKKEIKKITKPIENAADAAAAAARDAANRAAAEAARIAAEEAARAQALAEAAARAAEDYAAREAARLAAEAARIAALAERAALIETRFVANELVRPSQVLEAITPTVDFLRGTALSATSEIFEVEQELERIFPKVLNLNELELIAQLAHIRSVLERNNSLDLLRFWEPGWIEKVESRVSPLMAETGLPLLRALRLQEQEIAAAFTDSGSWVWQLAKRASAMAEDISNDLIKPMSGSFDRLAYASEAQPAEVADTEMKDHSESINVDWVEDDRTHHEPKTYMASMNGDFYQSNSNNPNLIKVATNPGEILSGAEYDEDDIFDEDCGYLPIPVKFGGLISFLPIDRKVPASCGGWKAKRSHQLFILASQVRDYQSANEDNYLDNLVGNAAFFKQPYGVAFDVRWLNAFEIKYSGVTVATVTFTPHIRFPFAWSTPNPSSRTLSTSKGNNLINNFKDDRFFFSPEFEVALHAGKITDPLLSALVVNVEFPIVMKDLNSTPHAVLQQIIVKVSYDRGIRWGAVNPKDAKDILNALALFLKIIPRLPTLASGAVPGAAVPGAAVPGAIVSLDKLMFALLAILDIAASEVAIPAAISADTSDDENSTAILTATMPFAMGAVGALARFANIDNARRTLFGKAVIGRVSDISLIKLQTVFGFLNGNYAAALLNREPTAGDAGFHLVRPGTPDYTSFGVALLPQVTQALFLLNFDAYKTALQLWGPYGIYTPQVASPRTVAGQVYLNNGTRQFEPMLLK
jgi:hypothetical protein